MYQYLNKEEAKDFCGQNAGSVEPGTSDGFRNPRKSTTNIILWNAPLRVFMWEEDTEGLKTASSEISVKCGIFTPSNNMWWIIGGVANFSEVFCYFAFYKTQYELDSKKRLIVQSLLYLRTFVQLSKYLYTSFQ